MTTSSLLRVAACAALCFAAAACSPPETPPPAQDAGVPPAAAPVDAGPPPGHQLGSGDHTPASVQLTVIADADAGLRTPRDLDFNPLQPDELWVVNNDDDSVVIVFDASKDTRFTEKRIDGYALHFMPKPSSIAFGGFDTTIPELGTFATCHESRNTYGGQQAPNDFMGPALWSSDLNVFAASNPFGLGSHLDMLHGSPDCMGIAHQQGNVYWVFGGKAHTGTTSEERHMPVPALVRYDFGQDHGIGKDDHSDGQIHQYVTHEVKRVPGIPSHLFFDSATELLYAADTGNSRVVALDTTSGTQGAQLFGQEPLVAYYRMENATLTEVVGTANGLVQPSGLELKDGLIYVSDNATGVIYAFSPAGERVNYLETGLAPGALAGMAFGPDGKLYLVDMTGHRVLRVDPL